MDRQTYVHTQNGKFVSDVYSQIFLFIILVKIVTFSKKTWHFIIPRENIGIMPNTGSFSDSYP